MRRWLPLVVWLLAGCTTTPDPLSPGESLASTDGVFVLNEGLWGQSNSSLSLYDPQSQTVRHDLFRSVNGRSLGDVGNFIVVRGEKAYIVVNGSDRIEIIEAWSQESRGTISLAPGLSPRQLVVLNDSLGLVTNLYDASVSVVSFRTLSEVSRIPVGAHPDGIAVTAGTAFVANSGLGTGRSVSMIDLGTLSVAGTLEVDDNPGDVLALSSSLVAVLCAGAYGDFSDPNDDTPATLVLVDPLQRQVVERVTIGGHAFRMATDGQGRVYVVASGAVLQIDPANPSYVKTFTTGEFYGVGVDTTNGDVYLADARTFTVPGEVSVFDRNGNVKSSFDAGLIPGRFAFLRR